MISRAKLVTIHVEEDEEFDLPWETDEVVDVRPAVLGDVGYYVTILRRV